MSNKITDARLEWLEETRRRKSLLLQKLEEEEQKMVTDKDGAAADDAAAAAAALADRQQQQELDEQQREALNTYQLNIDRYKEELAAIEKEFESWQEMGFSLPASNK
ncbi:hypothetical protein HDV57DRAFT_54745 [Trichoderma longibrachiatum]|uniref:Uncharacterized protein n=1 Tax=Trichoderma longibrachiatum ATCC 18648 TaxID=983965 RepID=A0A2T4C0P8_TRILO|nr:hypothetical protein M440DRAFT_1402697 [Trichoderma longibrachiatum ATCC 18648]